MKQLFVALVVGPLLFTARGARADTKAEAQMHVARATELHKAGKFRAALDELKTAYALDPKPTLLYAMGQLYVSVGECAQAIAFYERFLATRPNAEIGALASEAIERCKTNPPPVIDAHADDAPPPVVSVVAPPPVVSVVAPLPPPPSRAAALHRSRPWYTDRLGDGLAATGVVAGVVGGVAYLGAVSDRDRAGAATSYDAYAQLVDRAHTKRAYAVGFGAAGAALLTAGVLHYLLVERDGGIQLEPAHAGASVTWTGRF